MTFDNSKTIIGVRLKLFAATIIFLLYIVLAYVARIIKFPFLGISDTVWTIILAACYLIVFFLPQYLGYQFIYFSDDDDRIIFRYFNAGLTGGKKNSVEIIKNTFSGYKIESRFFGLIQSITLYQKIGAKIAKYPPIYISALTSDEKSKVIRTLNRYAPAM